MRTLPFPSNGEHAYEPSFGTILLNERDGSWFLEEPTSSILYRFSVLSRSGSEWDPSDPYDPGLCSSELLEASACKSGGTLLGND